MRQEISSILLHNFLCTVFCHFSQSARVQFVAADFSHKIQLKLKHSRFIRFLSRAFSARGNNGVEANCRSKGFGDLGTENSLTGY